MEAEEIADREGIRATVARYTVHGDRGNVTELVDCFTDDGVLELTGEWRAEGRTEILARTSTVTGDTRTRTRPLLRHHLATHYAELTGPGEANATTYFTAYTEIGVDHIGRYVDRLRRVEHEWRFVHRRVAVDWWAPDTIYGSEAARAASRHGRDGSTPTR